MAVFKIRAQGRNEVHVYGIRDQRPKTRVGSGITALGIGISVFSIDSRINIHWDQQNFVGSGIKIFITFGIRD